MRQSPIDLLPDSIRARSRAGVRTGRYITVGLASIVILVIAATHTRLSFQSALDELAVTREQANLVLTAEAKAAELKSMIASVQDDILHYERIALPLNQTAVLATVINEMPAGVSLDRIDLDAGARRSPRSPRSKGEANPEKAPPRVLVAEVAGFAPDDDAIAEFVTRLSRLKPLCDVSIDFSRTLSVRGRSAREFRLSFRIDLDVTYEVATIGDSAPGLVMEESDDE